MLGRHRLLPINSQSKEAFVAKRGRPPKKTDRELYEERKVARNKKKIRPGPWSNIEPGFQVIAKLVKNQGFTPSLGDYLGKYVTHDDGYEGDGYRALVKITVDNLPLLIKTYGLDKVLAACEKSLNSYKYKNKKKVLGDLVIMEKLDDEKSKRENYLVCMIKTNRKQIKKFMGIKYGILQIF
jgi:hypothetical protein